VNRAIYTQQSREAEKQSSKANAFDRASDDGGDGRFGTND